MPGNPAVSVLSSPPISVPVQSTSKKSGGASALASVWLTAYSDPLSRLVTSQSCLRLIDVDANGESKLVCADQNDKRVKLWKGNQRCSDTTIQILDCPSSLCAFYSDLHKPQTPNLAVAASSHIFIYRNLRPYFKFTLPPVELSTEERSIWEHLARLTKNDNSASASASQSQLTPEDESSAVHRLSDLRESGQELSARSLAVLALPSPSPELTNLIHKHSQLPLIQQSVITCMETLNKSSVAERSVSQLLVGSESQRLYIMEPSGTVIAHAFALPSVPVSLCVLGVYDIDYRIFIALRNNTLIQVKKHKLLNTVIAVGQVIVCQAVIDKSILIATSEAQVHAYSFKGKLQYTIHCDTSSQMRTTTVLQSNSESSKLRITCMEVMHQRKLNATVNAQLLLVCLSNGEVRAYNGKICVNTIKPNNNSAPQASLGAAAASTEQQDENSTASSIVAIRFGPYGREDNSLCCVSSNGALSVRMLSRNADFDLASTPQHSGAPLEQDLPLSIPKKTRLYVEQSARERESAPAMHAAFQRDLCRLRLHTIQSYVKLGRQGGAHHGTQQGTGAQLAIDCKVFGLGPKFKLRTAIKTSGNKCATNLSLALTFNQQVYRLLPIGSCTLSTIPMLVPQTEYVIEHRLECIDTPASAGTNGQAEQLRIYVNSAQSNVPIISAIVNMPVSEPAEE